MELNQEKVALVAELDSLLRQKRKLVASQSFPQFVKLYLSHLTPQKTPEFHLEIMGLLERAIGGKERKDRIPRLLEIAPRGFGKSRVNSVFFPLWLALFGKKSDIFLVSSTIALSKELLRLIRQELESNQRILEDFGELKSEKWTEEHLILRTGVQLRAKGRGFQIRGFRPDIIICDDLEDDEVIYSKEQRDKLEYWFFRTLLPSLKPEQSLIYVGTMLHQFSLIAKLKVKPEFTVRHFQALTDGKSLWEDLFPASFLMNLRVEIGEYAFQAEYQNNPISLEEQPIKEYMLKDIRVEGEVEVGVIAFDPAISERQTSDYRAIAVMGKTKDGFKELFSDRGRWSVTEQTDKIINIYLNYKEKFKIKKIVIEEVAYQRIFREILTAKAKENGIYLPIATAELGTKDDKRPKDKLTRLLEIVHLFEQKAVEINNPLLYQELLAFPFGEHDDLVDACVYGLRWLTDFGEGRFMFKKRNEKILGEKESPALIEVRPGVWVTEFRDPPKQTRNNNFVNFDG